MTFHLKEKEKVGARITTSNAPPQGGMGKDTKFQGEILLLAQTFILSDLTFSNLFTMFLSCNYFWKQA